MFKNLMKSLYVFVCAVIIVQLVGCGTIFYPERKGQKAGNIDVGIVLLDGIGLFFFLIPGIIAYAVDFSNGTIYLPGTSRGSLDLKNIKQVKFDPKHTTLAGIERIIKAQTGYTVQMDQSHMRIAKLRSTNEMLVQFTQVLPGMRNDSVALNR